MRLPVAVVEVGVLYGVAAMDHHSVPNIDTDVACSGSVVGSLEEYEIAGFDVGSRYSGTDSSESVSAEPPEVPSDAAVVADPAHKARAIE